MLHHLAVRLVMQRRQARPLHPDSTPDCAPLTSDPQVHVAAQTRVQIWFTKNSFSPQQCGYLWCSMIGKLTL